MTSKCYYPEVLLLASRYDLACDFVVSRLRKMSACYLRLNTEDLSDYLIELDPINKHLLLEHNQRTYCVTSKRLLSVFFRRPVFIRDYGETQRSPEEKFFRHQWLTFIRNLMIFDKARWINDPVATYRAEHKAVQLSLAKKIGFYVPKTKMTNVPHKNLFDNNSEYVAIKGIDTVMLRANGHESFGYTTFADLDSLTPDDWHEAPATIQTALTDKLDIRVTVIEDNVYAASILVDGKAVSDDWRQCGKQNIQYNPYDLPEQEKKLCRTLVKSLGLRFGGIDLALCDGKFYFLEINPTGEWAWLIDSAGLPIDNAIAHALVQ